MTLRASVDHLVSEKKKRKDAKQKELVLISFLPKMEIKLTKGRGMMLIPPQTSTTSTLTH